MNLDRFQKTLIAPTVGVLHVSPSGPNSAADDFLAELLASVLDQISAVADRSQIAAQLLQAGPGRIVFLGKNSNEPSWVTSAKQQGWQTCSVSPTAGGRESDLTYSAKIDPKAIVASTAEILVLLGAEKLPKDPVLTGSLLPNAVVVTYTASSRRYWLLDSTESGSHADFCLAVQNLVTGTHLQTLSPKIERFDSTESGSSIGRLFGGLFPAMVRLLSGRVHLIKFRSKPASEVQPSSLEFGDLKHLRPHTREYLNEGLNRVCSAFVRADEAAQYHGDQYRSFILLGLLLTLIAFLALILGRFSTSWSLAFSITEIAALFAILVTGIAARVLPMHRKWLVHRMIAELLRPSPYLLPLWLRTSRAFNFPERPEDLSTAIAYQRLVIREASPLNLHVDQDYLDDMRKVVLDLLKKQIEWHKTNADTHDKCHKRFVYANTVFFLLLLTAGGFSLFAHLGSFRADFSFVAASICTLCIAISGACIHYFSFDHIAERSRFALRRYQTLESHIDTMGSDVTYSDIKLWMQSATDVMADEQLDWFRQTSRLRVLF